MTREEIANLFIRAAWIDSRLPDDARPKRLKGSWVTTAALTEEDQKKWFIKDKQDGGPSQLHRGDDPMKDWWLSFWDDETREASRRDIKLLELAMELVTLVADAGNRRALWAWAKSKVGTLDAVEKKTRKSKMFGKMKEIKRASKDVSFAAWCRSEGIHEMTGSRRMNRAIAVIEQYIVRGSSQNGQSGCFGVLPVGPVFEHISDTPEADAPNTGRTYERDADTVFAKEATLFDWNEIRNQRRRMARRFRKERAERLRAAGSAA